MMLRPLKQYLLFRLSIFNHISADLIPRIIPSTNQTNRPISSANHNNCWPPSLHRLLRFVNIHEVTKWPAAQIGADLWMTKKVMISLLVSLCFVQVCSHVLRYLTLTMDYCRFGLGTCRYFDILMGRAYCKTSLLSVSCGCFQLSSRIGARAKKKKT